MKTEKPKAYINDQFDAIENVNQMLNIDSGLFDTCCNTVNFAFHFNQICNKAVHYHYQESLIQEKDEKIAELKETVCRCDESVGFICSVCHDQKYFHKYDQAVKDIKILSAYTSEALEYEYMRDSFVEKVKEIRNRHGISEE
jgi:hypothetical protein